MGGTEACAPAYFERRDFYRSISRIRGRDEGNAHYPHYPAFRLYTLAVRIFEMTSEGEWEQAALPAVTLVFAGLLPIMFFMRQAEK